MDSPTNIVIHWNCNGLRTRQQNGEIKRLVKQYKPIAVCLQNTNYDLQTFDQYNLAASYKSTEKELGTSIYVHRKISYQKVKMQNYNVQASTIKIIINKNIQITLCNMYN